MELSVISNSRKPISIALIMTTTIYISYSGDGIKKQDAYTYDAVGNRLTSHKNSDVGRWTLAIIIN